MSTSVITGAGSGIGRATALAFAKRGFEVALLGRNRVPLEETAAQVRLAGGSALVVTCDVGSSRALGAAAAEVIAAVGAPRVVVCNAGIAGRLASVVDTTEDEWDALFDVNLKGTFLTARAFLPSMLACNVGRVVAVSSISATLGTPRMSAYVASKWGVVGFIKSLAEELRGTGLQALSVLPGSVDTPMVKVGGFPPQMSPEDVAGLIVYAAVDAPNAMNGSSIEVFGP